MVASSVCALLTLQTHHTERYRFCKDNLKATSPLDTLWHLHSLPRQQQLDPVKAIPLPFTPMQLPSGYVQTITEALVLLPLATQAVLAHLIEHPCSRSFAPKPIG